MFAFQASESLAVVVRPREGKMFVQEEGFQGAEHQWPATFNPGWSAKHRPHDEAVHKLRKLRGLPAKQPSPWPLQQWRDWKGRLHVIQLRRGLVGTFWCSECRENHDLWCSK